ncbi:MAG: restriction endonuclease [Smithella sp.]|nr:restriction endonuclease [Smithella sp.]
MSIPSYPGFIWPLLKTLYKMKEPTHVSELCKIIADDLKISEEDRSSMLPSGNQPVLRNRIGWAQDALKRAKLTNSIKWGKWFLTDEGKKFVESHSNGINDEELKRLSTINRSLKIADILGGEITETEPEVKIQSETPEEILEEALGSIKARVAGELLDEIHKQSPKFFERLVVDLLHKMGYGADESALNVVGGSGDGGIDGIIYQDRLGLDKVYIQAKRWKENVGSPQIQTFIGALNIQGATKGIFITTSELTSSAKETVKITLGKIVVIDGKKLTNLMMECGVGVSNAELKVPRIDKDYFEE